MKARKLLAKSRRDTLTSATINLFFIVAYWTAIPVLTFNLGREIGVRLGRPGT